MDIWFAIDNANINDDILVLAEDNLLDFSLKGFIDFSNEKNSNAVMRYYEINTKGVYRSRFMGGGFNGSCLAIIDPAYKKEAMENIKNEYSRLHPEYADKVKLFICTSEDGVGK